jgi:putative endonuclease
VKVLVWDEHYTTMVDAIRREKQMKAWKRDWKIKLIEKMNPGWKDLHDTIDVAATLVVPKLDPSLRWGDGKRMTN